MLFLLFLDEESGVVPSMIQNSIRTSTCTPHRDRRTILLRAFPRPLSQLRPTGIIAIRLAEHPALVLLLKTERRPVWFSNSGIIL